MVISYYFSIKPKEFFFFAFLTGLTGNAYFLEI